MACCAMSAYYPVNLLTFNKPAPTSPDRAFFGLLRPLLYHYPTIAQETRPYQGGGRQAGRGFALWRMLVVGHEGATRRLAPTRSGVEEA